VVYPATLAGTDVEVPVGSDVDLDTGPKEGAARAEFVRWETPAAPPYKFPVYRYPLDGCPDRHASFVATGPNGGFAVNPVYSQGEATVYGAGEGVSEEDATARVRCNSAIVARTSTTVTVGGEEKAAERFVGPYGEGINLHASVQPGYVIDSWWTGGDSHMFGSSAVGYLGPKGTRYWPAIVTEDLHAVLAKSRADNTGQFRALLAECPERQHLDFTFCTVEADCSDVGFSGGAAKAYPGGDSMHDLAILHVKPESRYTFLHWAHFPNPCHPMCDGSSFYQSDKYTWANVTDDPFTPQFPWLDDPHDDRVPLAADAEYAHRPMLARNYRLILKRTVVGDDGEPRTDIAPECAGYVATNSGSDYYCRPSTTNEGWDFTYPTVDVHAVPFTKCCSVFTGWELDGPAPDGFDNLQNPLQVHVNRDRTITAKFRPLSCPTSVSVKLWLNKGEANAREILRQDDPATDFDDNVAPITAEPKMPDLTAEVTGVPAGAPIDWVLSVTFDPDPESLEEVTETFSPLTPAGDEWHIDFGDKFMGGNATLYCFPCGFRDCDNTLEFEILGTNPSCEKVNEELGHNKYRAICWHESAYRQFQAEPGGGIGPPLPCYKRDGGYGLMQITEPLPTMNEIWNWKLNIEAGQKLFDQKYKQSENHLAWWNEDKKPKPEPAITMTHNEHIMNAFALYRKGEYYYDACQMPDTEAEYELCTLHDEHATACTYADARKDDMDKEPWNTQCHKQD